MKLIKGYQPHAQTFECCGTVVWCRNGIQSFMWNLRIEAKCPSCGGTRKFRPKEPATEPLKAATA